MENAASLSGQLGTSRQQLQQRDYFGEAGKELGVEAARERSQQLRSLIRGTEQSLRGVESSVAGRTQGSNVTEAQRQRLVGLEQQPIADIFREQQGALSDEQAYYQNLLSEATQRGTGRLQAGVAGLESLGSQFGTTVGSETSAAQRALEEALAGRQLEFSREELAQQAALAAADRASRERIAAMERDAASRYQPDWSSILGQTQSVDNDARMRAIQAEAARLSQQGSTPAYQGNRNVVDTGGFGGLLRQGFQNVTDYGPLALFGGGSLWR